MVDLEWVILILLTFMGVVVLGVLLYWSVLILAEYERAVVFLLGRFWTVAGPGPVIIVPGLQSFVRVDLRTRVLDVPAQDLISKDTVSVKVTAVVYYRIADPRLAVIEVERFEEATAGICQTILRSVLGQHDLDDLLSRRDRINADLRRVLHQQTDGWGIAVTNVEIKEVLLEDTMVRAMARQAEAERERRARIIDAEGEQQAAEKLLNAATILARSDTALQLRYLSSLEAVAGDKATAIVLPIPVEFLKLLGAKAKDEPPPRSGETP